MIIKPSILAILMAITSFSVQASETLHHKLTRIVLDAKNVSYMIVEINNYVNVVVYNDSSAAKMCKYLQDKGVNVKRVESYFQPNKNDTFLITTKNC